MALCKLCEGINVNSIVPHLYKPGSTQAEEQMQVCYQHHETMLNLRLSSNNCRMCNLIMNCIDERNLMKEPCSTDYEESTDSYIFLIGGYEFFFDLTQPKRLSFMRVSIGVGKVLEDVDIGLSTEEDDPLALSGDIVGRLPARNPSSRSNIQLINSWLHSCMKNHDSCRLQDFASASGDEDEIVPLPTRLIRILQTGKLQLQETGHIFGRYIALSYCWGTSQTFTTTSTTINDRYTGFDIDDLPKTLRDAVEICGHFGIGWLWIDALCIIQDSISDWETESANMDAVYRNALVTISASAAKNTEEGIIVERDSTAVHPVKLRSKCSTGDKTGTILAHPKIMTMYQLDRSPLNNRAWCLQERVLARRVLHFCRDQLYWECQSITQSEDRAIYNDTGLIKRALANASSSHQSAIRGWNQLIEDYNRRKITKNSDKLPALSGVAKSVAKTLNAGPNDYLAGIWRQDLPYGLLWAASAFSFAKPNTGYRAPSWSWASIEGPIMQYGTKIRHQDNIRLDTIDILDTQIMPKSSLAPFGEITTAILHASSWKKQIRIAELRGSRHTGRTTRYQRNPELVSSVLSHTGTKIGEVLLDDNRGDHPTMCVDAILICSVQHGDHLDSYFLAVAKVEPSRDAAYRRIGVGRVSSKEYFQDGTLERITLV